MEDIILLKQGELVLKGGNRRGFETKLLANLRRALKPYGDFNIHSMQSTVYAEPLGAGCDMDGAFAAAQKVFGINTLSRAAASPKDKDAIFETAKRYLGDALSRAKSFKVESKRSDKRFPMSSIELSQYVGGLLAEEYPGTKVDLHNPELTVHLEVRDFAAYVHGLPTPGGGGLPVGVNGRAVTLLSGGIDSPVSSFMAARRGLYVIPLHFASPPYTSEQSREKVISLAKILAPYADKLTLEIVPFTHIQEEIGRSCNEALFTIVMRRFMMRIAERVALYNGCGALVTGENLGQVASQTMEALAVTQECLTIPVLRPVIGLDKQEIVNFARRIGTYDTSVLPFEDCCTVFTPLHPRTRPKLSDVLAEEQKLDIAGLEDEAFANIDRVKIR